MAKPDTTMSKFGATYDINAISNLALKAGLKPLTPAQLNKMTPAQIKSYVKTMKQTLKLNRSNFKGVSKIARKNAKLTTSENYKQAQLMHGTLRQAIAEAGGLGVQGIAQGAISKLVGSSSAVTQNTEGGTVRRDDDNEQGPYITDKGPVASYSYKGRDED